LFFGGHIVKLKQQLRFNADITTSCGTPWPSRKSVQRR